MKDILKGVLLYILAFALAILFWMIVYLVYFWFTLNTNYKEVVYDERRFNSYQNTVLDSVVKINDNCSAVFINDFVLLTAAHCVADKKYEKGFLTIENPPGEKESPIKNKTPVKVEYRLAKLDDKKDLALLLAVGVGKNKFGVVRLADQICVREGDKIWAVGYPGGMIRTVTEGEYNGYQMIGDVIRTRTTAPIFGGNSGGGLFQKCNGKYELIGISSAVFGAGLQKVPHMNISVTLEDIKEFVADVPWELVP